MRQIGELRPVPPRRIQGLLVVRVLGDRGIEVSLCIDFLFTDAQEKTEPLLSDPSQVFRPDHRRSRVFRVHLSSQDVVVRSDSSQIFLLRLVVVAALLVQILEGNGVQGLCEQDVMKRCRDIPKCRLPIESELILCRRQPDLCRADGGPDPPPREQGLRNPNPGGQDILLGREIGPKGLLALVPAVEPIAVITT